MKASKEVIFLAEVQNLKMKENMFVSVRAIILLSSFFFSLLTFNLTAQWQPIKSPGSAFLYSMVSNGTNLYAGSQDGAYILNSDGNSWKQIAKQIKPRYIDGLAIKGNDLFAVTCRGIFLSTNNGNSWNQIHKGLSHNCLYSVGINGASIFAGTRRDVSYSNGQVSHVSKIAGAVFVSNDNGGIWTKLDSGLRDVGMITTFAFLDKYIFVGSNKGVFVSNNNGEFWSPANEGLIGKFISGFAIIGTDIFVGTDEGMFISKNNGELWQPVNNGLTDKTIRYLAVIGSNIFIGTYKGVFMSTNKGEVWTPVSIGLPKNTHIASLAICGDYLFAGTEGRKRAWKRPLAEMIK
jgi:photosystem II stability/assembly factor-like uncharacterized protein